jgi:hypothetical protein
VEELAEAPTHVVNGWEGTSGPVPRLSVSDD